jgi:periplasmic protein TonB
MGQPRAGAPGGSVRAGSSNVRSRLQLTTRSLRIGVVYAGRVVEERLVPPGQSVSVGSDPACTVVVPRGPRRLKLIETHAAGGGTLHFPSGMHGKVSRDGDVRTLDGLLADGAARRGRRRCSLPLGTDARGKVRIGETTVLFQFVRTPPMPAKTRQRKFAAWRWGIVDWLFLAVIVLSGLIHASVVIWIGAQPPPSTKAMREIQDRFVQLIIEAQKPPPPETPDGDGPGTDSTPEPATEPDPEPVEPTAVADAGDDTPKIEEKPESMEERLRRIEEEVKGTGVLAVIGSAGDSSSGRMVEDLLADGTVGDAQRDAIVASAGSVGRRDSDIALRAGSSDDEIAGGGADLEDAGSRSAGGRVQKGDEEIPGQVHEGDDWRPPPDDSGYDVRGQMKRYLYRMKACYERSLKNEPDLVGKMLVSWTIEDDGGVAWISIDHDSTGSSALQTCVRRTLGQLEFTAPPSELEVEGYPLLFSRQ